jgi:hypothetical protein
MDFSTPAMDFRNAMDFRIKNMDFSRKQGFFRTRLGIFGQASHSSSHMKKTSTQNPQIPVAVAPALAHSFKKHRGLRRKSKFREEKIKPADDRN